MKAHRLRLLFAALILATLASTAVAVTPKVSVSGSHTLLLKSDGSVWAWGANGSGQLGTGDKTSTLAPVPVAGLNGVVDVVARGSSFSMALKADGTVWVWGNVSGGLTGAATSGGVFYSLPTQVNGLHGIVSITATFDSFTALAVDSSGKVWAWGAGGYGELGNGLSTSQGTPTAIAGLTDVLQISATSDQVLALRRDGSAYGWGYNNSADSLRSGQSLGGYAKPALLSVPTLAFLQAANSNTSGQFLGIDQQGKVLLWGDSNSGLLTCHQVAGGTPVTQPYYPTGFSRIKQIAGGSSYALFLDETGKVTGCGYNSDGELGDGTTASTTTSSTPSKPGPVSTQGLPSNISFIAAGTYSSAALAADGGVYTWGRASGGLAGLATQTASNNTQAVPLAINAGAWVSAPVTYAGTQNGPLNLASVDVGLTVAQAHVGQTGQLYLAVALASGPLLLLDTSGSFAPYDPSKPIAPFFKGVLPATNQPLMIANSMDLSALSGATLFLGYGLGSGAAADAEMIAAGRVSAVLTLR